MRAGRAFFEMIEASARCEELELPEQEFAATYGKLYKRANAVMAALGILAGIIILLLDNAEVGALFLVLGIGLALLLPTVLSYRCIVNRAFMREEYLILFFQMKKEVHWSDVKYKKVKIDGGNKYIKLYDANKKRLISFDGDIVGFERIVKMAKRNSIAQYKKE